MSKFDVAAIAVKDDNGDIDVSATLRVCEDAIEAYASLHHNDREKIGAALTALFTSNVGLRANVPAVKTLVLNELWDKNPSSFSPLMERIGEVLSESETIMVRKGPGGSGGCTLRDEKQLAFYREHGRDQTAAEIKAEAEETKRQAARK